MAGRAAVRLRRLAWTLAAAWPAVLQPLAAVAAATPTIQPATQPVSPPTTTPPATGAAPGPAPSAPAPPGTLALRPCWIPGWAQPARCGVLQRPLDPAAPRGRQIDVHVAVLPAQARNKHADAVLFFAGGPGQSAIALAGAWAQGWQRLQQRRDLVFIDQRGTGRSAPLACPDDDPATALAGVAARATQAQRVQALRDCLARLQALPHGDLRFFTTEIAMADADAVRQALGIAQLNLVGASYGTRAALSYLRQFPQAVRRVVLDGVVPPDQALPAAGADTDAAWAALMQACAAEAGCRRRHPALATQLPALLATLPRLVELPDTVSGQPRRTLLDRDSLLAMLRAPLYAPALAAGLPAALDEAMAGRFGALAGLAQALSPLDRSMASGMHFSVVCSEDMPSPSASGATPAMATTPASAVAPTAQAAAAAAGAAAATAPPTSPAGPGRAQAASPEAAATGQTPAQGPFAAAAEALYQQVCAFWPRGDVSAGFRGVPPATVPVWLGSGGLDPVTPPRLGQRVADALGPLARHRVVPNAGHGVLALACLREEATRFVDAAPGQPVALAPPACTDLPPRPPAFVLPDAAAALPAAPAR